jgi:NADPH:quinone reductase-like Zn-dependent oxidoreductase
MIGENDVLVRVRAAGVNVADRAVMPLSNSRKEFAR